jgi:hypothetical protein
MLKMIVETNKLLRRGIPKLDIRHNQSLIDTLGNVISKFRPDVQAIDRSNRILYLIEVVHTSPANSVRAMLLKNAAAQAYPGWQIVYKVVSAI